MDLLSVIDKVQLVTKQSKAGNEYSMLQVTFSNGYVLEEFVNNERAFIIKSME